MSQRKPKLPLENNVRDINDIKSEDDLNEFFKNDSSPMIQELLELRREHIASSEGLLTDEEVRYEVNSAKHGKQVADALRELEQLKKQRDAA